MVYILLKILNIIFYFLLLKNGVFGENINDANGFINGINNREEIFSLQNDISIDINDVLKIQSKRVKISGKSKNTLLHFKNNDSINLSFFEDCKEIEFKDISITGNFKFNKNINIKFDNVLFNGYFISENSNDYSKDSTMQLLNSEFHLINQYHGYEIYNYQLTIKYTKIYGNDITNLSLMSIINKKNDIKKIIINNSYFTGNYCNSAVNIQYGEIRCTYSKFEKFYNGKDFNSGGALDLLYTDNEFYSNTFKDNYSQGIGGSIYFKYPMNTIIDEVTFKNTSSLQSGGAFSMFNDYEGEYSNATVYNIVHSGNAIRNKYSTEGTFFCIFGLIQLDIYNYNGYDINTGSLMAFDGDVIVNIEKMTVNEIYTQNNAVVEAYNKKRVGVKAYLNNVIFEKIIQENTSYSAAFLSLSSGRFDIDGLKIKNVKGEKTGLIYVDGAGIINISNSELSNIHSKYSEPIFYVNNVKPCSDLSSIYMNNTKVNNIYENGVLFYDNQCSISVENSEFNNIHECYKNGDCSSFKELSEDKTDFGIIVLKETEMNPNFNFKNNVFNEIYGKRGMNLKDGTLEMFNCTIKNSYFQYGFTYYTNLNNVFGIHNYRYLTFENNNSEIGTFFYFDDIGSKKTITDIYIDNGKFINNTASSYGGIIYSNARKKTDLSKYVYFRNCIYENNHALFGKISYIYDDSHAPSYGENDLTYINQLKLDKNNFVTNPTHLKFDNYDETEVLIIRSDERIEKEYICSIYDDYENKFVISEGIYDALLDDLILYELSLKNINDEYLPTKIYGSYKGYCLNSSCKIKNIRLLGQPGDYKLILKIVNYGRYYEFKDNTIEMNIKIVECNETEYINQDKNGINIKSCYKAVCDPPCANNGKCINDNVCDCEGTNFRGSSCSERYKQERVKLMDISLRIISLILIISSITISVFLYFDRNHEIIKSASYDFLNLILFGITLNYIYVALLVKEDYTDFYCISLFILKNTAYSLIFGIIITKLYRVYYIFYLLNKKMTRSASFFIKFGPITLLLSTHYFIMVILLINNSAKSVVDLDSKKHEYIKCDYSRISILSSIINIFIIVLASFMAYFVRYMEKKYKEPLSVPVYSYIIYLLLNYLMEYVKNNLLVYYINAWGILIYSTITLYFLYIVKFKDIRFDKELENNGFKKKGSVVIQYQSSSPCLSINDSLTRSKSNSFKLSSSFRLSNSFNQFTF